MLEEFAGDMHEDIRRTFGYVPQPMVTKAARLAPMLASDGGADLVIRECLRDPPPRILAGMERDGVRGAAVSQLQQSNGASRSSGGSGGGGGAATNLTL